MSGKIIQKQNSKEAQQKKHGKAKKPQRNTAKDITRIANEASAKRSKKNSSPIVLDGFFFKKNSKHFHWLARVRQLSLWIFDWTGCVTATLGVW